MALRTDPYQTERRLRSITPATTGAPRTFEYVIAPVREVPPADPAAERLARLERKVDRILDLLGGHDR